VAARHICKIISNKFVVLLLLLSELYLLYHDYFVNTFKFADPIHVAILAYFFFIIGIVAGRNKEKIIQFIQKWKYIIFSGAVLSGLYVFWEGRSRFLSSNNYFNFYSQWRPSILIYSIFIGLTLFFIFEKKFQSNFLEKLIKPNFFQKLSKLSFFVFFIHIAVLESFWSLAGKNLFNLITTNFFGRILFDPVFFGVVAGISFLIAFLLHKIPKLYKLTG